MRQWVKTSDGGRIGCGQSTVNSLVYWSKEEVSRSTEPDVEDLECQEKELILYRLGKGEPSRVFEQGNGIMRSLGKINLAAI